MHLAHRGYLLVFLIAVLAIAGIWSSDPVLARLWQLPAGALLIGLALEGALARRLRPEVEVITAARAFLGRAQPAAFLFRNPYARTLALEYAPVVPPGFAPLTHVRRVVAGPRGETADAVTLLPVRLGPQSWPVLPARALGPFALAWWST